MEKIKSIFKFVLQINETITTIMLFPTFYFSKPRDRKFSQLKESSAFSQLLITKSTFSEFKTLDESLTIADEMIEAS